MSPVATQGRLRSRGSHASSTVCGWSGTAQTLSHTARGHEAPINQAAAACPISKFAIFSSARTIAEWSHPCPPCATQALNSSCAMAVLGKGTPGGRALDSA
eukprot:gene43077-biopygen34618